MLARTDRSNGGIKHEKMADDCAGCDGGLGRASLDFCRVGGCRAADPRYARALRRVHAQPSQHHRQSRYAAGNVGHHRAGGPGCGWAGQHRRPAVLVTGTISAADEVNLVGLGGPDTVNIRGRLLDDGGILPCVFEGTYRVTSLRGSESGDIAAVHQVSVTGAPSIGGSWAGTIGDRGRLTATFAQSRNGVLTGRIDAVLFNPQPDPPGFEFTINGQAAWDGHTASYLLIGGADDAIVTTQLHPARDAAGAPILTGLLRLHRADGSVEETAVQLHQVGA